MALSYLLSAAILAVLLQAGTRWAAKKNVPFGRAFGTAVIAWVIASVITVVAGYATGELWPPLILPALFPVLWLVIPRRLGTDLGSAMLVAFISSVGHGVLAVILWRAFV